MRKESALVLFKPSVLNFFEEYYFKVTTSSSYRTLGIVCLHTDTSNGIYFILHWCRPWRKCEQFILLKSTTIRIIFLHLTMEYVSRTLLISLWQFLYTNIAYVIGYEYLNGTLAVHNRRNASFTSYYFDCIDIFNNFQV
jgi:hypothetical protein